MGSEPRHAYLGREFKEACFPFYPKMLGLKVRKLKISPVKMQIFDSGPTGGAFTIDIDRCYWLATIPTGSICTRQKGSVI